MAIFGKPPSKKTPLPKSAKREAHVVSARELAAQAASRNAGKPLGMEPLGETSQRGASVIDWSTAPKAIEVAQANPGLCATLENAALLFANGQDAAARELLEQGVQTDQDTKLSPLAWLALFDLMQRANDRAAFDQLAMQFVLQFERSAPSWDERQKPATDDKAGGGGYIAVTGKLSGASAGQLEGLKRALEKCVPRARIDLSSVVGFDDAPWAALVQPPLTVVSQPAYEIGKIAADLLFEARENPRREPREVILRPELIVRESSRRR